MPMPTFDQISTLLAQRDGALFWRSDWHGYKAGDPAGFVDGQGYRRVGLFGKHFQAHRIVWMLVHGEWPTGDLDHINGVPGDNRIENLRIATSSQNAANRRIERSLPKGVTRHKCGRFQVMCGNQYIGLFKDPEAAGRAYDVAAVRKYGEFAKTNFGDVQ